MGSVLIKRSRKRVVKDKISEILPPPSGFFSKYRKILFGVLFFIIFCLLAWGVWFELSHSREETFVFKNVRTVAVPQVVAGLPVKMVTLVDANEIKNGKHLVKIPKSATDITVKKITPQEIRDLSAQGGPASGWKKIQITPEQRTSIIKSIKTVTKIKFPNFLTAGLFTENLKYFLADEEQAVQDAVSAVIPDINSQLVDVSATAPVEQPAEPAQSPSDNVAGETPAPTETPPPDVSTTDGSVVPSATDLTETTSPSSEQATETPAPSPAICATEADCSSGQTCVNAFCATPDTAQAAENTADIQASEPPCQGDAADNCIAVQYTLPAPVITSQATDTGQLVTVSATNEDPSAPLVDVLASTKIPKIFKVGEENKIKIRWKNNGNQDVTFHAQDTDGDGYLDTVEWTVPHLSDQIFDIIFISKAFQLDENQNILADIYDTVQAQDGVWATVPDGNYVRFTFQSNVSNTKSIDIYAKPTDPNSSATIEVYPVYTDAVGNQTEGPMVSTFPIIDHEDTFHATMGSLGDPTDMFDFKIVGSVDLDYVQDASTCNSPASGSSNWNNTGTWSCSHVPVANDIVNITAGGIVTMDIDSANPLGAITVNGTLNTSTSGTSYALYGTTLTIGATGVLTANASTIILSGTGNPTFSITAGGIFNYNTSTVDFIGISASVYLAGATYYNLQIAVGATLTANRGYYMNGVITVTNVLTVGPTAGSYTATLGSNGNFYALTLSGTGAPLVMNSMGALSKTDLPVNFTGDGATTIAGTNYYSLTVGSTSIANADTYTLGGNATIWGGSSTPAGTCTVTGSTSPAHNATFDASSYTLTLGTLTLSNANSLISSTSGTIDYAYNSNVTIKSTTYYNLQMGVGTTFTNATNTYSLPGDVTVNGTLTITGTTVAKRILVQSNTLGTPRTITAAAVTASYADFRDITGAGAATWNLSGATGGSGDCGGNTMQALGSTAFTATSTQTWNGTTGSWSDGTKWTNGTRPPLPQDTVVLAGTNTVTADMPRLGKDISFTGATPLTLSTAVTSYGNVNFTNAGAFTPSTNAWTFESGARTGTITLTSAGKTFYNVNAQPFNATLSLGDAFLASATSTFTLYNGTFDANGKTFQTGMFASNNSNIRTLTMGSGTWTLTGTNTTIFSNATATNMTLNRGNPIICSGAGTAGQTRSINPGVLAEASAPSFNITAGSDTIQVAGASQSFYNLDFTGFTGTWKFYGYIYGNLTLGLGMTTTNLTSAPTTFAATSGTKTITSNGVTMDFVTTFDGVGGTWQLGSDLTVGSTRTTTLTNGTLKLYDSGNTAHTLSTGLFSTSGSATREIDGPGTLVLASTGTIYTSATATGLTFGGTSKITIKATDSSATLKTITAGSVAGFPSLWLSAGSNYTLTNVTNCVNFSVAGHAAAAIPAIPNTINGSLTLDAGVTMPAESNTAITFGATSGTKTITSAGQSIKRPLIFNGSGGTWQLADALTLATTGTSSGNLTVSAGTFDPGAYLATIPGTFSVSGSAAILKVNTLLLSSNYSKNPTLASGATINYSGSVDQTVVTTLTGQNLAISGSGIKSLAAATVSGTTIINGGTLNLTGNTTFSDNVTVNSGGTFSDITSDTTLTFVGGKTVAINAGGQFTITGTSGDNVILTKTGGSNWNFTMSGGYTITYATVSYSTANTTITPTTSTDGNGGGTNVNWTFAAPNSLPTASSMAFGGDVSLTAGTTKTVTATFTVTDADGCSDIDSGTTKTAATFYRTNIGTGGGNGYDCTPNNANCYTMSCTKGSCAAGVANFSCTAPVQYYADATDTGSPNAATTWTATAIPADNAGANIAGINSTSAEMISMTALNVTETSINYTSGTTLGLNSNTGTSDQTTTITNEGNRIIDSEVKGYGANSGDTTHSMSCVVGTIPIGNEKYTLTGASVAYASLDYTLTGSFYQIIAFNLIPTTDGSASQKYIYWGMATPSAGAGACTGTVSFMAANH